MNIGAGTGFPVTVTMPQEQAKSFEEGVQQAKEKGIEYGLAADAGIEFLGFALDAALSRLAVNPSIIREIVKLPDGARLTPRQLRELKRNIRKVLENSLPTKANRGRVGDVVKLFNTDPRFRFIDQIPGARAWINKALGKYGASLD